MSNANIGYGLTASGQAWVWGNGDALGNNTTTSVNSPVQVVGNHNFIEIEGALNHTAALKDNGEMWTWGINDVGQLGDNTITDKSSPVQIVGNHSFIQMFVAYKSSIGLKADGSAWSWGLNDVGQLGQNDIVNKSSPVQIVGNHSFTRVVGASGLYFGYKAGEGTFWGWGDNGFGQLGNNTTTNTSSPVQLLALHTFIQISTSGYHTLGLKSDGSAWSWGANSWGQLGVGAFTTSYSSPVQVVGSHSFKKVITEYRGQSYGIKADGSVWAWGQNLYGQLGTNNLTSYNSPVQVVGNHSFMSLNSSIYAVRCMKADGSIWMWGEGSFGQLGTGAFNAFYSSPVQVIGNISFSKLCMGIGVPVNISGVWRRRPAIVVKQNNQWMRVASFWVKQNSVWNRTDYFNI